MCSVPRWVKCAMVVSSILCIVLLLETTLSAQSFPSISALMPSVGPVGTSVAVTGSNFGAAQGSSTITFNGTTATPTSWSDSTIVVPVPSGTTTGNVIVTVNGVVGNGVLFAVGSAPSIISLSPNSGVVGTLVTVSGTSFGAAQGGSSVTFNGTSAIPVSWSQTAIGVAVPTGATTGNVVVSVGGVGSNGVSFAVNSPPPPNPTIASVAPPAGPIGTGVTISGSGFGSTQGSSFVTLNGTVATPTYWSATLITVSVPAGATTGNVVVNVGGVTSNTASFAVGSFPAITTLSPNSGGLYSSVSVSGGNFGATQGTSTVTFNGMPATPTFWGPTQVNIQVPPGATTGNVVLTVGGVASNGVNFTVTSAPGMASLSPILGIVGASVTISGSNFGATQGSSAVTFNGITATPSSWNDTSIVVPVPAGASTGTVFVSVGGAFSNGLLFTVGSPSSISSLSTTSGPIGAPVTITGSNFGTFQSVSTVTFNGTVAAPISWADNSIVVPAPIGATTGDVVVTVGGTASNGVGFTVTPGPGVSSLSPTLGPVGTVVTVTGNNFGSSRSNSTVTLNGTTGLPTTWTDKSIVVPVPVGAATGNLVVTVAGIDSNPLPFSVVTGPTISSRSPSTGAPGAAVTITGSNFGATQDTSTVTFNGTAASPLSWSSTSIVVPVPNGSSTGNIVVTVASLASNGMSFTVGTGPAITSLSPTLGPATTSVTVTGQGFGASQGGSFLNLGSTAITPGSWSDTSIVFSVPTGATSGNVSLFVGGKSSNYVPFKVGSPSTITGISPSSARIGEPVTLTGSSFGDSTFSSLTFNGTVASPTSRSDTSIVVPVPAGATSGNVVVNLNGVASNGVAFTVLAGPGISAVLPSSGAVGATIRIFGKNFGSPQGSSLVTLNGTVATPTSWDDGLIFFPVPNGASTGSVLVTVDGNVSDALPFTVVPAATITSVSPTSGGAGVPVTITGTNFGSTQGNSTVKFSARGVSSIVSWTDTSIVAKVPSTIGNASDTGPVTVTTNASGVPSNGITFTTFPSPIINSLSPTSGAVGTAVTIAGSKFGATQAGSTVAFNGASATPTSWSDTSISVAVPSSASVGPVVVAVNGAPSTGTTFTVTPSVTTLSPTSGTNNVPVTISGSGFGNSVGSSSITFNGMPAHATSWATNTIVVPVPNLASTGPVVVKVNGNSSNGVTFTVPPAGGTITGTVTRIGGATPVIEATVTALQSGTTKGSATTTKTGSYSIGGLAAGTYDIQVSAATYVTAFRSGNSVAANATVTLNIALGPAPTLASISPNWGNAGTSVSVSGSNFGAIQGVSTVSFNGVPATPSSWSDTALVVPVPAGASSGPVVVTVGGVASNGLTFSVGTGSLTGTITSAADSTPVNGALVEILKSNVVIASGTTAPTGSYSINLSPGTYDVRVSASGFGNVVSQGKVVAVGAPTSFSAALPAPGSDTGTVTSSSGATPIVGAQIAALQNNVAVSTAVADASGNFSITNLSPGTYVMQASAPGYTSQSVSNVTITAGSGATTNFSLVGESVITYQYDEVGRLIGVVDSQNGSAVYNYDAVGNITSIVRKSVGDVGITSFTPRSGPIGTTVTINGTGFSATPSQNAVTLNGTTAVVSSASPTQLITSVPSGSTTGPIVVTETGGSATSSTSFTVTGSGNAPVLSGVSPAIAAIGSSVTLSGTNFDTNPVNDTVTFNAVSLGTTTTASTSNLAVTVPANATTGKLSLSTPAGKTASSSYLFVAPAPHPATDIVYTGQIASLPGAQTVSINATGKMAILAFDGVAGQRITLQTASSTFPNGCAVPGSIVSPRGVVVSSNGCMGNNNLFINATPLAETGTYTVQLGPDTGGVGQVNITLGKVQPDITATLYPGGASVGPLTTTTPGQKYLLTFNGTAGKRISFLTTNGTFNCGGLQGSILNPDGTTLATNTCLGTSGFIVATPLLQTGTYLIQMNPSGSAIGTVTITLYDVPPDPTATLVANGSATVQTTTPGQQGRMTFTGTAGEQVSLNVTSTGVPNFSWWVSITKPDGTSLLNRQASNTALFMDKTSLPANGTYSILIFPDGHTPTITGSWTANLYDVPADVTGSVTIGGSSLPISIATPGQNAAITFSGTASQNATVKITGNTMGAVTVTLLKPDNSTLAATTSSAATFNLGSKLLPTTGTYTIKIDPNGAAVGNLSVNVTTP
jgi:YD repeat-containing protein